MKTSDLFKRLLKERLPATWCYNRTIFLNTTGRRDYDNLPNADVMIELLEYGTVISRWENKRMEWVRIHCTDIYDEDETVYQLLQEMEMSEFMSIFAHQRASDFFKLLLSLRLPAHDLIEDFAGDYVVVWLSLPDRSCEIEFGNRLVRFKTSQLENGRWRRTNEDTLDVPTDHDLVVLVRAWMEMA